jgi:hypothetical protein
MLFTQYYLSYHTLDRRLWPAHSACRLISLSASFLSILGCIKATLVAAEVNDKSYKGVQDQTRDDSIDASKQSNPAPPSTPCSWPLHTTDQNLYTYIAMGYRYYASTLHKLQNPYIHTVHGDTLYHGQSYHICLSLLTCLSAALASLHVAHHKWHSQSRGTLCPPIVDR